MNRTVILLWSLNLLADCCGQLAFKAAAGSGAALAGWQHWRHMLRHRWLWLGIGCYLLEFLLWLAFLSLVPLSTGVMLGSFSIVVLMLAGRCCFREKLTGWRIAGMVLITLGVVLAGARL